MPVIDLRGKQQERQAQMLMMMQQFRNRSTALGGGETELERVTKEIEAEKLRKDAADRAERSAQAQIGANQALEEQRQSKTAVDKWKAGQENILHWEKSGREERELTEGTLPLRRAQAAEATAGVGLKKAQTGEAQARTSLVQQDIEAKKNWITQQQDEALMKHVNDTWNMGVQNIKSGNPSALEKDNADNLEAAGRIKFGPGYKLPRLPDGSLDPQKAQGLVMTMTDIKGQPDASFAKDVKAAEKPDTPFEATVRDMQQAKATGNEEAAKWFGAKLWNDTAPTVNKTQGALLKQMLDDGDVDGYKDLILTWRKGPGKGDSKAAGGLPPAAARQQTEDGMNTLGQIDRLNTQFNELVKSMPTPPTGRMVMPMYDFWAAIQHSNPDVQAFRANLKDVVAQYRKFITGKASNEKEMADLLQAVPNENDDTKAFAKKMAEMRWKTTRRIRTDLGMQQAYGLKLPEGLESDPTFAPISPNEAIHKWGSPDITTDSGQRMWHAGELERGKAAMADSLRRTGQQIGGMTEFRDKQAQPAQDQQQGMSVEPDTIQQYYNNLDPKLQPLFQALSPEDQIAVMQGQK